MRDATTMLGFIDASGVTRRVIGPSRGRLDEFLAAFVARPTFVGFPNRRDASGEPERLIIGDLASTVKMYVNEDRWVGNCPHCNSGIAGIYRLNRCVCLDCGRVMAAEFPSSTDVAVAEVVLSKRPEINRNWYTDREDVDDLKVQNLERGLPIT
jgi:hypothetical protein